MKITAGTNNASTAAVELDCASTSPNVWISNGVGHSRKSYSSSNTVQFKQAVVADDIRLYMRVAPTLA